MYLWKGFTSHTAKFYNEKTRSFTTKFPENFIVTVNLTFDKLYFCFINIKKDPRVSQRLVKRCST